MNGMCGNLANVFYASYVCSTSEHSKKIFVPWCNTNARKGFFSVCVILKWNSLPNEVVSALSISKFKSLLCAFLGEVLFDFV